MLSIVASTSAPLAAYGSAAPSLPTLVAQLEQSERHAAAADDAAARLRAAARADDIRAQLLTVAPDDERAATWLADRAAHTLDVPAMTGLDLVVLLGVPTREQMDMVLAAAERALDLANRADAAATQAVARLETRLLNRESMPDEQVVADLERRLRTLVDVEQSRRIPYLRASARTMIAASTQDFGRAAEMAQSAVRELKDLPAPGSSLEASKHLLMGLALVHAAGGDRAQDILKAAKIQFENALALSAPGVDPGIAMRARVGLVRIGAERTGEPPIEAPGLGERARKDLAVLIVEARAADALMRARLDATRRIELVTKAVRLLATTSPTADEVSLGEPDRRPTVQQKIAESVPKGVPLGALPAEAAFATAVTAARNLGGSDPQARAEVAAMFQSVVARLDTSPELRSQARWERAVVIAQGTDGSDDRLLAEIDALADVMASAADSGQDSAFAYAAARRIADVFAARASDAPHKRAALDGRFDALVSALRLLVKRDESDRWPREIARLALAELERAEPQTVARAMKLLDVIPGEGARAEATRTTADAAHRRMLERRERLEREGAGPSSAAGTWQEFGRAAEVLLSWAKARDPAREVEYRVLTGEAKLRSGEAGALDVLSGVDQDKAAQAGAATWTRWKFALASAQRTAGEGAKAFNTLREIADRYEGEPGQTRRATAYWQSWARMLEILASMNADGSRTADIRAQIKRLELIDPLLGGGEEARVIREIRSAVDDGESRRAGAPATPARP